VAHEREWRSCAYEGIRTIIMPASTYSQDYAEMIAEDQVMTEKVAQGEMTRTERRARLDAMREEIAAKEAKASELSAEHAERNAALVPNSAACRDRGAAAVAKQIATAEWNKTTGAGLVAQAAPQSGVCTTVRVSSPRPPSGGSS
jgi:hypothetical protein